MKKYYITIIIIFILYSCENFNRSSESIIEVEIQKQNKRKPFRTSLLPFSHANIDDISLKGMPKEIDSFSVQYLDLFSQKSLINLRKISRISENEFLNFKSRLYAYSAYSKGKQIVIIDSNFNLDFSDDKKIIFNEELKSELKSKPDKRDSLPQIQINHSTYENGKIAENTSLLNIFPYENYFTYPNNSDEHKFKSRHQLIAEKKEYFYGEFEIRNNAYKVAFKHSLFGTKILFHEKETPFLNRKDTNYKEYELKDIVKLHNNYYLIDSINVDNTQLIIRKVEIKGKAQGHLKDYYLRDFSFDNVVTNEKNSIQGLCSKKKFLLLDFWGTWCAPCIKLTPKLVRMSEEYNSNLNILSIAFQEDKNALINYIAKNGMDDWHNAFIEGNPKGKKIKSSLLQSLRIKSYPTFILIDENMKIVYRGTGEHSLNEIEKIVRKN